MSGPELVSGGPADPPTSECAEVVGAIARCVNEVLYQGDRAGDPNILRHVDECSYCAEIFAGVLELTTGDYVRNLNRPVGDERPPEIPPGMLGLWLRHLQSCYRRDDRRDAASALQVLGTLRRQTGDLEEAVALDHFARSLTLSSSATPAWPTDQVGDLTTLDQLLATTSFRPTTATRVPSDLASSAVVAASHDEPIARAFLAARSSFLLWSAAAAAVVLIGVTTFTIFRARSPETTVALGDPPPAPPPLAGLAGVVPPSEENATAAHIAAARTAIEKHDYAGALQDHLKPVLSIDPANQDAIDLKRQAEAAFTKPAKEPPRPVEAFVETVGVPRKPNESVADYSARVSRMAVNLREGNRFLEAQDFVNALVRFRSIEGDQKGYQNVDALIADTLNKQRVAVEIAINNGQQNEQAKLLPVARAWYQKAMAIDPGSSAAHARHDSLLTKMNQEAHRLFSLASTNKKLQNKETARKQLQQIVDMMLPGDDISIQAKKELEALKQ